VKKQSLISAKYNFCVITFLVTIEQDFLEQI